MRATLAWVWFAVIQVISLIAAVVGWVLLVPFCLARAWEVCASALEPTRTIDRWRWKPLNSVYGNPEDGVSGKGALVWNESGTRVTYMPDAWDPLRAYLWSAWRNSANNLKYVFAWAKGPLAKFVICGIYIKAGWQQEAGNYHVPIFSLSRKP